MEGVTMATILEGIGVFFTQVVTWGGQIISMIVSNPLLLLFVAGFLVVGFVLGWVSRLFRTN